MKKVVVLAICIMFLTGCATITTGPQQRIAINSNPQGAKVFSDSGFQGITPCSGDFERKRGHLLTFNKDGYETATCSLKQALCGSTAGNIILGGVIGVGVDAMTGSCFKLTPENVNVTLIPKEEKK